MSPDEKYNTDVTYRTMVDSMTQMIRECHFTPSEMREMAIMASINYELRYAQRIHKMMPDDVKKALDVLHKYRKGTHEPLVTR